MILLPRPSLPGAAVNIGTLVPILFFQKWLSNSNLQVSYFEGKSCCWGSNCIARSFGLSEVTGSPHLLFYHETRSGRGVSRIWYCYDLRLAYWKLERRNNFEKVDFIYCEKNKSDLSSWFYNLLIILFL